jgi:N-sulfoglucosamine sulfohydrolase
MRHLPLLCLLWVTGLPICHWHQHCLGNDRPNILWISCEDISANLGCYDDPHAITPHLDSLAREGVKFTRAFTPAGVCAVVRSSVITGMYAPAIGSQNMRSEIIPPAGVKCFSEYLRAAGYFCTNRDKTDYQFDTPPSAWDRQGAKHKDWRERRSKDQPFFSVVNLTISHESQIRHSDQRHAEIIEAIGAENARDPDKVADTLPAYLPDTPAVRRDWAWYHDNITRMDQMVGEVLGKLEEDGLADSTIVVFWSDHGMGMPRGKRWLYDTGTHVPVIVRWPGKIKADSVREDLVSVIDLPPTMLSLAGVEVPRYMQGRVILGDNSGREPAYLFFHRDRMDEVFELQRAARDRRWKYIRNFEPEKPYAQHLDYMDKMPSMVDWRRLAGEGQLTGGQKNWFAPTKPIEELYDTANDPWELENLAEVPQYAERLARMRRATQRWQDEIGDTGMLPEAVMMEEMFAGSERPVAEPPRIIRRDGEISLLSATEEASIVYRTKQTKDADTWSDWQLYTRSISGDSDLIIQAQACRAGYVSSPVVQ